MKKLWEQPLRRQLFVFILLLLVPVLGAAVWSAVATYRERVADLHEQTRVAAVSLAETLNREVRALDRLTQNLDGRRLVESPDPGEPMRVVRRMQSERPGLLDLAIVHRSGEEIARAADHESELSDHWWADAVISTGKNVVAPARSGKPG